VATSDGKLATIWLDGRKMPSEFEGNMALMHTTVASDGALGPETLLDDRTCECCQTAMAATPEGLIAVYRDRSDKEIRDISIVRYANGAWSQPEPLSMDGWEIDGCPINGPAISSNGNNVAVAWLTGVEDKGRVFALMSTDSGKTFGKKIQIDGGNPLGRVDVVSLPSGAAMVSWIEATDSGAQVQLRRIGADGVASSPINVSGAFGAAGPDGGGAILAADRRQSVAPGRKPWVALPFTRKPHWTSCMHAGQKLSTFNVQLPFVISGEAGYAI
jgi:hypothetical protein